jgi:dimethylamine/trimethylamine dehydrogenase
MTSKYDILFEPIKIGPVTSPNRFYQVPHCNGYGYRMPRGLATMRGLKAEGGWGVVSTEEVEIHHTSDIAPYFEGRIWNDKDIPGLALMADAVHKYGSLAAIELVHNGLDSNNLYSRVAPLGPISMGSVGGTGFEPVQSRRMDKEDIKNVRRWHRNAAIRAKKAGFDIVYCYAGHGLTMAMQFITKRTNDRTDEYGGSLENRIRFFRELIEDTKDAVGDTCGIAARLAVDELVGADGISCQGEGYDIISMLAELPDLWDVNVSGWSNDSATSRFEKEGYQEKYTSFVKTLTTKPVVGVGRYTSPDSMVSAVKRGVLDMIGAARPSIADPFLPNKVKEDRLDDIRECIGCNICVTGDTRYVPLRCTQNPTMGEEWRRGWHPETIKPKKSEKEIMVVGAGPSGLEAARALGARGYQVAVLEARRELGGRVLRESTLPGLNEWRRVIDWRITQINKLKNVEVYPSSEMTAEEILSAGIPNIILATGATYRRDGRGRNTHQAIPGSEGKNIFTPDDLMCGKIPSGKVVLFDDDHYYMGGVLAEFLVQNGCTVDLLTPAPQVSYWTEFTLEQQKIEKKLLGLGIKIHTRHTLHEIGNGFIVANNDSLAEKRNIECDNIVLVTDRISHDSLYYQLLPDLETGKLESLKLIGDAEAPNIIAQAVYSGHKAAQTFENPESIDETPFEVEGVFL